MGDDDAKKANKILRFLPFQSLVDAGFWHRLSSLKLNQLGLDDSPIPITGFYAPCSHHQVSNHLTLLAESLPHEHGENMFSSHLKSQGNRNRCPIPGTLYNTNTLEAFRALDKQSLIKTEAKKIWDDIHSGKVEENSALLLRFIIISFADLKKFHFHYWLAYPALIIDPPATFVDLRQASHCFTPEQAQCLSAACNDWRNTSSTTDVPFFLVSIASHSNITLRHLRDWEACKSEGNEVLFGFYDPCNHPSNPGWPLRNYLAYISARWGLENVKFFCYRESRGFPDMGMSLVGEALISVSQGWKDCQNIPKVVGWETNKGKMASRCISLAETMDPTRLAISAADLNLKLMRWRALPSLNLNLLSATKCLLLGAGTLGCQVARMLMAWGVRKITMLDSGKVTMSNPLRQSLYILDDCLSGGKFKAEAAAESLKRIFPAVEAGSVVMDIPMPGHSVPKEEEHNVLEDCTRLQGLISSHDVIFLLTDTRESRWLPSLLCATANKITITAALGFDSFLVMRHGAGPMSTMQDLKEETHQSCLADVKKLSLSDTIGSRERLGCYFCNDVVAPVDSTANRTLDQQCTVTRPGLAPIASALAVELMVGILHHPCGIYAKAEFENSCNTGSSEEQPLGILPHQIRGSLSQFSQMSLVGHASSTCTGCCSKVVSEFEKQGMNFVLEAINHPTYLEDVTGLTELIKSAGSFELDWENETEDIDADCVDA
ncbi:unnamed protein product [Cuscuta epithymum]|uniref:Ubiquitin-like modifier-activating enzyme ATG7 n=1 Tax=Cuscuta epithymum TaxID=186058 RepID=A0AAV0EN83_9ASTE|nr:unnamed protein product [Cuscuta epithymum]CAH9125351.1 unnamed protein product [Cuscuta epithymum]